MGKGSTFYAVLNRVHGRDATNAVTCSASEAKGHSQRLLVVESDPKVQALLLRCLSAAGFGVEAAATAEQASKLAESIAFDGLTLELLLQDRGGLAVLDRIGDQGLSKTAPSGTRPDGRRIGKDDDVVRDRRHPAQADQKS
jgi:PleD family two-component response regulator